MNEFESIQNENEVITLPRDYPTEIIEILRSNLTPKILRDKILDYHENDIASAMEQVSRDERKKLFSVLNTELLASVLEYSENRKRYLSELTIRRKIAVLSNFEPALVVEYQKSAAEPLTKNTVRG